MRIGTLLIEYAAARESCLLRTLTHCKSFTSAAFDPETLENRTLMRVARAIGEGRGDFEDADVWALGQEALGLLDVVERTISARADGRALFILGEYSP